MSCGVITSAWLWRISSFWVRAIGSGELGPFLAYLLRAGLYTPTFEQSLTGSNRNARAIAVRRTASLRSPMSRASTSFLSCEDVDGRDRPGHDAPKGASHAEFLAEIEPADVRVIHDILSPALHQDLARVDDVGAVGQAERLAHIVVGDQHAD